MNETISVTIDGRNIEVAPGTTILKAAEELGIRIPTLCTNEHIHPYAACRICAVELHQGKRIRMVTACNFPLEKPAEILTRSERVLRARRINVELLMARCSTVPVLQRLARELGIEKSRFGESDEECILCGLCVRVCAERVQAHAIGFAGRGIERTVTTAFDGPAQNCLACGACAGVCPTGHIKLEDSLGREVIHSEMQLGPPRAISLPFMQAVPNKPAIDPQECIHFKTGGCGVCAEVCEKEAINYDMEDELVDRQVGQIIVATGFQTLSAAALQNYGYGKYPNVLTSLEFERMNCASGPTGGKIMMENGQAPRSVGILHCVGSRDENYHKYCSRVCCMYALKFAHLIKDKTGAEVYNFYIDLRCFGKGYEEFYNRLLKEDIRFIRGKAAEITDFPIYEAERNKLIIRCEDTLVGAVRRIPVDMVILCNALEARDDARQLARQLNISQGADGWFIEKHPKLGPVETTTDGVYLAGVCQGPKDIPDSVAQGKAAASTALSILARGKVELEATTSFLNSDLCSGCRICIEMCPYGALDYNEEQECVQMVEALCKGCGTCAASCPSGAIKARHFTDRQIMSEIEGVLQ